MGGRNHQPCKPYLKLSTTLSRKTSAAQVELELANCDLEDLILDELDGNRSGSVSGIVDHLNNSRSQLQDARTTISALRAEMDRLQYEDLPTLATVNLTELGHLLQERRMVQGDAWNQVVIIMKEIGFYGVLDLFDREIVAIETMTTNLIVLVSENEDVANVGELNTVLEENRPGNFKVEFAQLYSAWAKFQQTFLASSMLSTELWYCFNNAGSLIEQNQGALIG